MPDKNLSRRRFLIAKGTAGYEDKRVPSLPSVEKDVARVKELFTRMGYEVALSNLEISPTSRAFRSALGNWTRETDRNDSDIVVVYYSGHGEIEQNRHYLLTADSNPDDLLDTAIPTEDLGRRFAGSQIQLVLLLIDTCYAGSGAGDIAKVISEIKGLFSKEGAGFFVIAAARPKEEAWQGIFAEALASALNDERLGGALQEFLVPTSVSTAVNRYFRDRNLSQLTMVYDAYAGYDDPPFFSNPRFKPNARSGLDLATQKRLGSMAPEDILVHWGPRSRGVELDSQAGWYFTGRNTVLREIVSYLGKSPAGAKPLVITGAPGAGKSAVLSRLVMLADPEYRARVPLPAGVDEETIPPGGAIDVAVHVKGKTVGEVLQFIGGKVAGDGAKTVDELLSALKGRAQPATVVVDALDEAKEPEALIEQVLLPAAALDNVRLLVGTRGHMLGRFGGNHDLINLDDDGHKTDDIQDYVSGRLLAASEPETQTPYRGRTELARAVAKRVAEKANGVFLIARLVAENLIKDSSVVDPADPAWIAKLPGSVVEAFQDYLRRFGGEEPRVRDLLLPLAYAEGEGLPWANLWAPLASAVAERSYTDEDVAWVREKAGAYIAEALESGQSVYRLYHQALADYFHNPELDGERNRRIASALMAAVPVNGETGSQAWLEANPYVRQHLSAHAAAGGMLAQLISDPMYLVAADPTRLLAALNRSQTELVGNIEGIYKQVVHRFAGARPDERASYLEMSARKQGEAEFAARIARLPLKRLWKPKWAWWQESHSQRVLEGHSGSVDSVAVGRLCGRDVIVSGGWDGTVRVWDAETGEPAVKIGVLTGHSNYVTSVAVGRLCGREVIVSGSWDGTVRVWDVETGMPAVKIGVLTGHSNYVTSVAVGWLRGREVIVSGSNDKTVRVWDVETGKPVEKIGVLTGHSNYVTSVAVGRLCGREVIVSGSETVRVWDAETGKHGENIDGLTGHSDYVASVAVGQLCGQDVVISGHTSGKVRVWDAETGKAVEKFGMLTGHSGEVTSVAVGRLRGRDVIVSGSNDNTVRVWDMETGKPVERIGMLTGHSGEVTSVAVGRLCGRDVIVSGSSDKTVRVWDVETGNPVERFGVFTALWKRITRTRVVLAKPMKRVRPFTRYSWLVTSVAVGRVGLRDVIVSGSNYAAVRVWDAETGRLVKNINGRRASGFWVPSVVVVGRHYDRDVIVSASWDEVAVWDAETGKAIRKIETLSDYMKSVAVGRLCGRDVIVSCGKEVWVWDVKAVVNLGLPYMRGNSVAVGRLCGRDVIVSGGKEVRVWDARAGRRAEKIGKLRGHSGEVASVALGQMCGRDVIVSGSSDKTVRAWDAETGKPVERIGVLTGHSEKVTSVAMGRLGDRDVIISGSLDKTVRVWDAETGKPASPIFLDAEVHSVSAKGALIATGTSLGIVVIELSEN
jgi:WD40 repeat protein